MHFLYNLCTCIFGINLPTVLYPKPYEPETLATPSSVSDIFILTRKANLMQARLTIMHVLVVLICQWKLSIKLLVRSVNSAIKRLWYIFTIPWKYEHFHVIHFLSVLFMRHQELLFIVLWFSLAPSATCTMP